MNKLIYILAIAAMVLTGCSESFLDTELRSSKLAEENNKVPADLHNLVLGVMDKLNGSSLFGRDLMFFGELRSDNVYNSGKGGRFVRLSALNLLDTDGDAASAWSNLYNAIQQCNDVINNKTVEENIEVLAYKGQAKALRAMCYFELHRLFGQKYVKNGTGLSVPLVLEYKRKDIDKIKPSRNTIDEVETQIENDIIDAIALLEDTNFDKIEMNQDAAIALYSRFALTFEDYETSKAQAEAIIESGMYDFFQPLLYEGSYIINQNMESIFEFAYTATDGLGTESYPFLHEDEGYGQLEFVGDLLEKYSANDVRKPYVKGQEEAKILKKFPELHQNNVNIRVVRYAEIILNYVECAVRLGEDLDKALTYMNNMLELRGAEKIANESELTLDRVLKERRLELAGEGHRFYDLIRNHKDIKMFSNDGSHTATFTYPNDKFAFPIPLAEMNANKNITNQNSGY